MSATQSLGLVRHIIRKDLDEVLSISDSSFCLPWSENHFIHTLRQRTCIGYVAERGCRVVGYMITDREKFGCRLLNLAVSHPWRWQGVGRQLIERLVGVTRRNKQQRIEAMVRESDMEACRFLRKCGFLATDVVREIYDEGKTDGYRFVHQVADQS